MATPRMADHPLTRLALLDRRVGMLALFGLVVFMPAWLLASEVLPAWQFETAMLVAVAACALLYSRTSDD